MDEKILQILNEKTIDVIKATTARSIHEGRLNRKRIIEDYAEEKAKIKWDDEKYEEYMIKKNSKELKLTFDDSMKGDEDYKFLDELDDEDIDENNEIKKIELEETEEDLERKNRFNKDFDKFESYKIRKELENVEDEEILVNYYDIKDEIEKEEKMLNNGLKQLSNELEKELREDLELYHYSNTADGLIEKVELVGIDRHEGEELEDHPENAKLFFSMDTVETLKNFYNEKNPYHENLSVEQLKEKALSHEIFHKKELQKKKLNIPDDNSENAVVDYILQNKNISKYEKVVLNNHLKSIEFRKEAVKRSQDKRKYFDSSKGVDLVNMYKIFIETDKETKIFEKFKTKFESLKKIII
jgi:hypothetical protein